MLCSFFRFMISSAADSAKPLGPWTHRHVVRCNGCRRFHRTCRTLGEALRSEAVGLSEASGGLTRQVLAGLPHTQRRPARPLWPAIAAAACVALAIWIVFAGRQAEPRTPPVPPTYAIVAPRIELATWTRAVEAPLLTEAHNLSNSARSGLRFLVACLPVRPPEGVAVPPFDDSAPPSVQ